MAPSVMKSLVMCTKVVRTATSRRLATFATLPTTSLGDKVSSTARRVLGAEIKAICGVSLAGKNEHKVQSLLKQMLATQDVLVLVLNKSVTE